MHGQVEIIHFANRNSATFFYMNSDKDVSRVVHPYLTRITVSGHTCLLCLLFYTPQKAISTTHAFTMNELQENIKTGLDGRQQT